MQTLTATETPDDSLGCRRLFAKPERLLNNATDP
jgi:hypothetical protein